MRKGIYIGKRIEEIKDENTGVETTFDVHSICELSEKKKDGRYTRPLLWEKWDKDKVVPEMKIGQLCELEIGYKNTKDGLKPCIEMIYTSKG